VEYGATRRRGFFNNEIFAQEGTNITDPEKLKEYLGRYFPRSYAEHVCIFDALLSRTSVWKKQQINILAVGAGTGGDVIGLLQALFCHADRDTSYCLWCLDRNQLSLNFCRDVVSAFGNAHGVKICCTICEQDICDWLDDSTQKEFDFILASKSLSEVIINGGTEDIYYDFARKSLPMLSKYGVCLVLDTTIPVGKEESFVPDLLNEQISRFLRESGEFRTILPSLCRKNEMDCTSICYQQNCYRHYFFKVYCKGENLFHTEEEDVTYRLITRETFASQLVDFNITHEGTLPGAEVDYYCRKQP
jgi:hypothetical protein